MRPCAIALLILVAVTTLIGHEHGSWNSDAPKIAKWDQNREISDRYDDPWTTRNGNGIGNSGKVLDPQFDWY